MSKHEEWLVTYLGDGNDSLSHLFFDESKHKRDKSGRFAKKDGGLTKNNTTIKTITEDEFNAARDIIQKGKYGYGNDRRNALIELFGGGAEGEKHADNVLTYIKAVSDAGFDYEKVAIQVETSKPKKSIKDKMTDSFNSAKSGANETVGKIKDSLGSFVDKVSSSAKSGKDKTSSLISKGKKYLDNAFTTTTTTYHTQAEKMGNSAKKGLTTVKTTFNTQAEKLKQKKKSLFTKTKYDTSSYKNA